jgi:type IV secretion system protein VirD4
LRNPHLGNAWNPLAIPYSVYVRNGSNDLDKACELVNDIANNLSKIGLINYHDPYWENSAASFFFGLTMLLFKYVSQNDLSAGYVNIRNVLKLRDILCKDYSVELSSTTSAVEYAKTDSFIYSLLIGTLEAPDRTQACILSVFDQIMRTFVIQPSLLNMLAFDDNTIEMVPQTPTAVFLIVPDEKTSYHSLVSLYIKQSYEYFIYFAQKNDGAKTKQRINYILDEFSSLPTINDFPAMITAARSRNIRFTLFVQSKHQLDLRYREEAETIRANCDNWIYLVSREISLLSELSTLCGTRILSGGTVVPVLSITDLQRLDKGKGEALVLYGRHKPFISRLLDIDFYDNGSFKRPIRTVHERVPCEIDFEFKQSVDDIEQQCDELFN